MRRFLLWFAALVLIAAGVVFLWLPGYVENSMNGVLHKPPYRISSRARDLMQRMPIVDLHADSLLWARDLLARSSRGQVDIPRLIEGHVALQAFTIVTKTPRGMNFQRNTGDTDNITRLSFVERWPAATWSSLTERALYQASRLRGFAARANGKFTIVRSAADLRAYLERRRTDPQITAGFLGVEGAHALDGDLANIDRLYDAGIRMMAPTHFFDNDIGGSSAGADKIGLTAKGREMIRRMEARHMLVDLAHASARTIDDVLSIATRPVIVSHTGVKGTCDNSRNLSDDQLRGVARTGGVIGIAYFEVAVCGTDAAAIARAIRHAADVAGVDAVALGSDFDGAVAEPFDTTGLGLLIDALFQAGFREDEIAKIMGGNALRVLLGGLSSAVRE
ncbi:MAG: membrane dipeptidase [Bryobacteraceae bacterium]|jgi:microsomal dipeptidase-like Zn-dependent dipeptidase